MKTKIEEYLRTLKVGDSIGKGSLAQILGIGLGDYLVYLRNIRSISAKLKQEGIIISTCSNFIHRMPCLTN
jgi:hypothetical protein